MRILFSLLVALSFATTLSAQGIEFFHGTFEEAKELARAEEKIIFVDAYAEWCGPCKRMAANVFTVDEVGAFHNSNFINMKMDMEKTEGRKFGRTYPVSAFPTLFYIDYTGEIVHKVKGGQTVEKLIKLGNFALSKIDRSGEYAEAYENGDRDPELIYNYVKELNRAGKSNLKIANEYLKTQKDLTTPFNLKFLIEAASVADSKNFDLLIKNKAKVISIVGEKAYLDQITKACKATALKAVEFESADLLDEAKSKLKANNSEAYKIESLAMDMAYYEKVKDAKGYLKACNACAKEAKGSAKELHNLAKSIHKDFGFDNKCMSQAEKIAKEAAELGKDFSFYYTYANILYTNGKKDKALEAANKSLELSEKGGRGAKRAIEQLIQKINS